MSTLVLIALINQSYVTIQFLILERQIYNIIIQMGNQCTSRAYSQANSDTKDFTKNQQCKHRKHRCQIILAPKIPAIARQIPLSVKNSENSQGNNEMRKSHIKKLIMQKNCDFVGEEADILLPVTEDILQYMETDSTLPEGKNQDLRNQIKQRESEASHLKKSRITVNIESPSQLKSSLASAWNKSNFDQTEFFQKVKYDQIFLEITVLSVSLKK